MFLHQFTNETNGRIKSLEDFFNQKLGKIQHKIGEMKKPTPKIAASTLHLRDLVTIRKYFLGFLQSLKALTIYSNQI